MVKTSEFGKINTGEIITAYQIANCHASPVFREGEHMTSHVEYRFGVE